MSKVVNEAKIKNPLIVAVREQLEHRATWLYLLCDEANKRGLDPRDFGSAAVKRCGLMQGKGLVEKGKTDSLIGLRKTLFTKPAQFVFEMKILESTDDKLSIDFHYCPLVKAWQKAGCTDEEIAMLCDIAMCGDHGIGECYKSVLELPKCIAKGDKSGFMKIAEDYFMMEETLAECVNELCYTVIGDIGIEESENGGYRLIPAYEEEIEEWPNR